jgi:hypothetical protein
MSEFIKKGMCMKKYLLAAGVMAALIGIGCAKTESENIKTSGFYANYNINVSSATPTTLSCEAYFTVEANGTYIDLSDSDTVTCNGQAMSKSVIGNIVTYSTNLTATVGGTYTIVLTRSGESPYSATVTLPEAVAGTTPADGSNTHAKGSQLNYTWTPSSNSADTMYMSTSRTTNGDLKCPDAALQTESSPEDGAGSFSASQMALPTGGTAGACSMGLTWRRTRTGTMPSGLNGYFRANQTKSITIIVN